MYYHTTLYLTRIPTPQTFCRCPSSKSVYVHHEPDEILKDNDLRGRAKMLLSADEAHDLAQQIDNDAKFLTGQNLMDYSLLGNNKSRVAYDIGCC